MSLLNLIEKGAIKKFTGASLKQIVGRLDLAGSYLYTAKKLFNEKDQNNNVIVYTNIYDSVRMGCEAFLLFKKCKAVLKDHHKMVFIATKDLINNTSFGNIFIRFDKMRTNRNNIDYGVDVRDLSNQVVEQAFKDANAIFKEIGSQIGKKDPQIKIIF
jgi:uncharacterized alkaline shock family protein YloU